MLAWHLSRLYMNISAPLDRAPAARNMALYLHLPFCDHKCAYCDFNSYAGLDYLIPSYVDALVRDIELWAPRLAGWRVETIFFGGGTPSLTPAPLLARILGAVDRAVYVKPDVEVTLEANPGTVDQGYLEELRALGVNRLSLGVQTFDDGELELLDRIHNSSQAIEAYRAARSAGFDNINLDLMFGLQAQDLDAWRSNLQQACALAPEHLSLYGLTVEPGTKLAAQVSRGAAPEPDADVQADMYEAAEAAMSHAGFCQYEISNWSQPRRPCRHNLDYWRNLPYLGLGAGSHSCFLGRRFAMVRAPGAYIKGVAASDDGSAPPSAPLAGLACVVDEQVLDLRTDASDTAILGLRLNAGVDLPAFAQRYGFTLTAAAGPQLQELTGFGLLEQVGGSLRLTARGRLLSNEVFLRLLPDALRLPAEPAATASSR
jgi:oxygen-independent coproporphyrinogen-3 oxidase